MSLFKHQFSNVIEWNEVHDDMIFWLWDNQEIKKGSRLIIRPGQDAIVLYNGRIEGIFTKEGNYEVESDILPFLTTLSSFKFGFNAPLRAEVLFVNRKEFLIKWGTKNAIHLPAEGLKGGLPIRSFGTFSIQVNDYLTLIERIAGVRKAFRVEEVKERVVAQLDQLLMRWISKEGKDLFNLQANAREIAKGIQSDLQEELADLGLVVTDFTISSFNYPETIQSMIEKTASHTMVGDLNRYQQLSVLDALSSHPDSGMASMVQSGAGMAMGLEMMRQFSNTGTASTPEPTAPLSVSLKTCHHCEAQLPQGANFCSECGTKVFSKEPSKFCPSCGNKAFSGSKFCGECGHQLI